MNEAARKRAELKSYFKKKNIPTEDNFSDLIDSFVNYADDGFFKTEGNPLSIEAVGEAIGQKRALSFFNSFADTSASWTISLNPRSDADNLDTANTGFSLSDASAKSRLFIEQESGKVGVGTITPRAELDVSGTIKADGLSIHDIIDTPTDRSVNDTLKIREDGGATWIGGELKTQGDLNIQGDLTLSGKISSGGWQIAEFTKMVDGKRVDSSWRNFVDVYDSPTDHARASFFKDPMGFVHLRGLISDVHSSVATRIEDISVIFILPEGHRPQHHESFRVISRTEKTLNGHQGWGDGTRIDVAQNGEVKMVVGDSNWLSLAGITFYAAE